MAAINSDRARAVYLRQRIVCLVAALAFLLAALAGARTGSQTAGARTAGALTLRALSPGSLALGAVGVVLLALSLPRWRGRAPVAWLGTAIRFATRTRHAHRPDGLFPLVAQDATVLPMDIAGTRVGAIAGGGGLAGVIEIGDPSALLVTGGMAVPTPAELAGSPTADEPSVATQMLLVRRAQFQRLFVAVRVGADGIGWTDVQLRQALSGSVRGVVRRLARLGITGRTLSTSDVPDAIGWAVHGTHDLHAAGADNATIHEHWDHLRIDETLHKAVRLVLPAGRLTSDLLAHLVCGPASASAVSIGGESVMVRLAAPTPAALAAAVASVTAACPGAVRNVDGQQRAAFAATLPLGHVARVTAVQPATVQLAEAHSDVSSPPLHLPDAGLLLGRDRRGAPIFLQLDSDRTAPIRLAVVGSSAAARVLSERLRALADGARGHVAPVAIAAFERLAPADATTLASADVVVCQPVSQAEAALVASALRLTRAGAWLSRIEGDMIAIISHGAVRWAQLSANADEMGRFPGLSGLAGVART